MQKLCLLYAVKCSGVVQTCGSSGPLLFSVHTDNIIELLKLFDVNIKTKFFAAERQECKHLVDAS